MAILPNTGSSEGKKNNQTMTVINARRETKPLQMNTVLALPATLMIRLSTL
jgi:hypothetical protein